MKRHVISLTLLGALVCWPMGCTTNEQTVTSQKDSNWADAASSAISAAEPESVRNILPSTHFAAGQLFENQGAMNKAVVQYQRAVDLDPDHVPSLNRMGVLLARLNQHAAAERALLRAVEIRPDSALLLNNLGFEYVLQKRWTDAEEEFRNAIALMPDLSRARINLGVALAMLDRYGEALEQFRAVLPEPDAFYNLGLVLRSKHQYHDAAGVFQLALDFNPDFHAAGKQLEQIRPKLAQASTLEPTANDTFWRMLWGDSAEEVAMDELPTTAMAELDDGPARAPAQDQPTALVDPPGAESSAPPPPSVPVPTETVEPTVFAHAQSHVDQPLVGQPHAVADIPVGDDMSPVVTNTPEDADDRVTWAAEPSVVWEEEWEPLPCDQEELLYAKATTGRAEVESTPPQPPAPAMPEGQIGPLAPEEAKLASAGDAVAPEDPQLPAEQEEAVAIQELAAEKPVTEPVPQEQVGSILPASGPVVEAKELPAAVVSASELQEVEEALPIGPSAAVTPPADEPAAKPLVDEPQRAADTPDEQPRTRRQLQHDSDVGPPHTADEAVPSDEVRSPADAKRIRRSTALTVDEILAEVLAEAGVDTIYPFIEAVEDSIAAVSVASPAGDKPESAPPAPVEEAIEGAPCTRQSLDIQPPDLVADPAFLPLDMDWQGLAGAYHQEAVESSESEVVDYLIVDGAAIGAELDAILRDNVWQVFACTYADSPLMETAFDTAQDVAPDITRVVNDLVETWSVSQRLADIAAVLVADGHSAPEVVATFLTGSDATQWSIPDGLAVQQNEATLAAGYVNLPAEFIPLDDRGMFEADPYGP